MVLVLVCHWYFFKACHNIASRQWVAGTRCVSNQRRRRCKMASRKADESVNTGDPLHSRALAHSRAPLFTQPCPHCSHSRTPGEQCARLCVFTLQGCVRAAWLFRGSPVVNWMIEIRGYGHIFMMTSSNGNIFRVTGQWRGALMLSLICVWINDWVNNREAGDLRRYRAHCDVIVMGIIYPYVSLTCVDKSHQSTAVRMWVSERASLFQLIYYKKLGLP